MTETKPTPPAQTAAPSLYEQLGGEPAVAAVVDIFYDKVLGDPELRPYFTGVDLDRLKAHQRRFVGQALGATRPYSGRSMRAAHQHLAITPAAFERVMGHLAASLADAGVEPSVIGTIAEALQPLREEIVTA
ncbi:group I truncated hemoglobin [Streptomyces zingiberis]|uniref:Group 1 truncated hemoglobin n=1 Tax=Streptomyces zingiberis TaxID=2053010 RepID=A0ABX1BZ28_9ACTN|nr:group 1 truncated hemoglobin [Streptomyces zingiberis]NJQ01730.1 group 1 truncated hemoglobin [Streptomyces zingiberis]